METMTVSISKSNFARGLKTVKGWGFQYDAGTQTWSGKVPMALQSPVVDVPGYLRQSGLVPVAPSTDPATTWQGSPSMDAADSSF